VRPIVAHLEAEGWSVWWDRSLVPGATWPEVIERELKKARCVIVVWSEHSIESPWVRLEANKAREKRNLVPISLDNALVPPEFSLFQAVEFTASSLDEALTALARGVKHQLDRNARRRTFAVSAIAALAALFIGGGVCYGSGACAIDGPPPERSLAILTFDNQLGESAPHAIADAFIDEVREDMAQIVGQSIASRAATRALPETLGLVDIGRRLQVRWLLAGKITESTNLINFALELVDASTGYLEDSLHYELRVSELEGARHNVVRDLMGLMGSGGANDFAPPATTLASSEAYVLYLTGKSAIRKQHSEAQLMAAEQAFNRALALEPGYPEAQAGLCSVYLWRYETSRSIEHFRTGEAYCRDALGAEHRSTDAALALARLYYYEGDYPSAEANFNIALSLAPSSADAYIGLADVDKKEGRWQDAERNLRAAIESQPGYWRGYNGLGLLLLNVGRTDEGQSQLEAAVALSPEDPALLNNLAVARLMAGEFELAMGAFQRVVSIDRGAAPYANLGNVYYWLGQFEKAAESYATATELDPQDYRLWSNLGDAQRELGERDETPAYDTAVRLIGDELAVNTSNATATAALAAIEAARGHPQVSRNALSELTAGSDPEIAYLIAISRARLGDDAEAIAGVREAAELGYPKVIIRRDPAFAGLREQRSFQEVLDQE
jgi:Tfp pilus assembly protein PilF/TolB-like protein